MVHHVGGGGATSWVPMRFWTQTGAVWGKCLAHPQRRNVQPQKGLFGAWISASVVEGVVFGNGSEDVQGSKLLSPTVATVVFGVGALNAATNFLVAMVAALLAAM